MTRCAYVEAHKHTSDTKYLRRTIREMQAWNWQCPSPQKNTF